MRPTPAMAVALVALFAALGGSAIAVTRASVRARDISRDAVRSRHIKAQQVRSSDVRNGSLRGRDIQAGSLDGSLLDAGTLDDLRGPRGLRGLPGLSGVETIEDESLSNSSHLKTALATCPGDKVVTGMGATIIGGDGGAEPAVRSEVVISSVDVSFGGDDARAIAIESDDTPESWSVQVQAICADVPEELPQEI